MYSKNYPNMFKPLKLKNLTMKNRVMSAPNMIFHVVDNRPDDYYIGYLEHKARGGAAIVTLGEMAVGDGANHVPEMIKNDDNLPIYAEMAQVIHEHGAIASVELTHGGNKVKTQYNTVQPMSASESISYFKPGTHLSNANLAMSGEATGDLIEVKIKSMTKEDMEHVCQQFADTAAYMLHAGFDAILLHYGHTWLPDQFFSPIMNTRTDEFGGPFENRMKFPLMIAKAVRDRVGPNVPVMIRLSGSEYKPDGFDVNDMITFLEKAQEYIDLVEVSGMDAYRGSTYYDHCIHADLSEAIKKSGRVHIPVFTVGNVVHPEEIEEIIASGKADGVSVARALLADPFMPEKVLAGRRNEVTPCLHCWSCIDSDNDNRHLVCSVNPLIGREARLGFGDDIGKAQVSRKVLVVGGGPAGMEAAITASRRGHEVTLAEKSDALGGLLKFTDADAYKADLRCYKNFLVQRTKDLNIRVLLNTEVTPEFIADGGYEDVVIATGSVPVTPNIPGIEKAKHATEIYYDPEGVKGDKVVIIGGGLVGVEAGLHLQKIGKNVVVLEAMDQALRDAGNLYKMNLMYTMRQTGVMPVTGALVKEIVDGAVIYEKDGEEFREEADSVYYAVGMKSVDDLYFNLDDVPVRTAIVGDAKKVGKVAGAIHTGYFAATDIGKL
ncbi:MAG: FAD-dependent oxidoreductase [bacterium]|nr:FAD-dependent oxidoreductase [bacterium]